MRYQKQTLNLCERPYRQTETTCKLIDSITESYYAEMTPRPHFWPSFFIGVLISETRMILYKRQLQKLIAERIKIQVWQSSASLLITPLYRKNIEKLSNGRIINESKIATLDQFHSIENQL